MKKIKKENDIQTYKEIVAFTEGKKLDELHKAMEVGKRPYQNELKVIISGVVTAAVFFLVQSMCRIIPKGEPNWYLPMALVLNCIAIFLNMAQKKKESRK